MRRAQGIRFGGLWASEDSALMRRAQGLRGFNGIDGFYNYFTV